MAKIFMYEEFDVIVYAPLEEEYKGLQIRFIPDSEIDGNNFTGYKFTNDENITILFVHGFDWGNDAAYTVMNEVFSRFKAKLSVCIGIGGAITDDAKLGDVFYSKEVLDLTQRLKTQRDGDNNSRTKYDPKTYLCSTDLVKALDRSRLSISGKSIFKKWQESCELINRGSLVSVDTTELGHQSHYFERPNANNGKIAATNTVLADKMAVEDVKSCGRKITCVDTESAGFARSCNENQNSGAHIIIRAISDLADENKKLTEESFSNIFRDIAVSNAALFFSCHLGLMLNSLKEIPKNLAIDATLTLKQKHEREIDKNEQSILKELTARSIAFKSLEQKNGMPVPRIRPINLLTEVVENKNEPAIEIEEALKENNNISIDVPKNYPDNALPWLYAHQLAEANLHGKYTIPICIPNNEFGPPKNNLVAHLQSNNLEFAQNNDDYHIVFIFTNFKISSRSKSKYLSDSVKEFHNASVIIFPDVLEMEIYNNELEKYFNHKCYNIEAISFTSITQYMSSAFEIPLEESEVVATRLVSTFNNYRLNIHPTYLASIQKDTVASFIEANQRGELIELAVAGLLTLLVSDDSSQVRLKRTTRESFLSELAVNIYARKQSYTHSELIQYVDSYAEHMGFDINSRQFIDSFLNNGILVFNGDHVDIPIPVIKSYMLAKGLVDHADQALAYFDFNDDNFDFSTFDLYSEFSNCKDFQNLLLKKLNESTTYFKEKIDGYDQCVTNGDFQSHLLSKTLNLGTVSKDINKQAQELVEVTNSLSEKQMHYDVQSEIAQSHNAQKIDVSDREKFKNEHISVIRFLGAAIFLGAAAENLSNEFKEKLIFSIIELAELICTDLLTIHSKFDVPKAVIEVIDQIEKDKTIQFDDDNAREQFSQYVELMVADWQFNKAIHPLMTLMSFLCEAGRTNVLLKPILSSKANSHLQEFFKTFWAFDMEPSTQKALPKNLSKKLGQARFLRMAFAIATIKRIYWYHSSKSKKSALAKGIDEILQPLSMKSDIHTIED